MTARGPVPPDPTPLPGPDRAPPPEPDPTPLPDPDPTPLPGPEPPSKPDREPPSRPTPPGPGPSPPRVPGEEGRAGSAPALLVAALLLVAAALLVASAGCESRHPPDQVLRDSLGLEGSEEVHRVSLEVRDGRETAHPSTTEVAQGVLIEFVSADRFVRVVEFREEELSPEGGEFLRRTGQLRSAPLLARDARFVVSFRDAPAGRYPYRAEGNYGTARGVVVVRAR